MQKINRIGEQKKNNYGNLMTIVEYNGVRDIIVEFENGCKVKAQYNQFKKGNIKNPYNKTLYNIGYIGEGSYNTKFGSKHTIQYDCWKNMMNRCYDEKSLKNNPTYKDCKVCEEWHNFQNFAKWFDENYYEINSQTMHLDKDILQKGNKIYSPETCVFVPQRINKLFTKSNATRGDLPIGVIYRKDKNKNTFQSQCSIYDKDKYKPKHLGYYNTPEEAFYKYKEFKENYIKEVAEEYKDVIPVKLYEAMINYVVEITD